MNVRLKKKPLEPLEARVFTSLQRTAGLCMSQLVELLKPAGLSPSQYNVLRILRDAPAQGLACGEVAERMVTRDPDITRLIDRLEKRGLAGRSRHPTDRRVVTVRITAAGRQLIEKLDAPVARLHDEQLAHLGRARLRGLAALLEQVYGGE
jgi:DNA-binding MarR family transcriptional regulator